MQPGNTHTDPTAGPCKAGDWVSRKFALASLQQAVIAFAMGHERQDEVSLELARRVAAGLPRHPEWLELARENLKRWSQQNQNVPALLRCYSEWERLLSLSVSEIAAWLTDAGEEGQRLRQNSPFAGVLKPEEVWEIKARLRRHATAAA